MLTLEVVKSLLDYNPETGVFLRKKNAAKAPAGSVATKPHVKGYLKISIKNKLYLAHRIAWFLHYGEMPGGIIDHINQIKTDNRICNLRICSYTENLYNSKTNAKNTSGHRGVYWNIQAKRWTAKINNQKKQIHLGNYKSKNDAIAAYRTAAIKISNGFISFDEA
jgi:hypothetical protein